MAGPYNKGSSDLEESAQRGYTMINARRVMGSARAKTAWAVLLLAITGLVHAATSSTALVGGGSTLPGIAYVGSNAFANSQVWGNSVVNTFDPIAPGSLFGVYNQISGNPFVSYCQSGDVSGKNILAGPAVVGGVAYNVQNFCGRGAAGVVTGFGAALSGVNRQDLTQPNFVAADSPLNSSDYGNYVGNHPSGDYPTQFPAIAGSIAIALNLLDAQGSVVPGYDVNFSDLQLCAIFSGEVTNWNDPRLASAFNLPAGHSIPSAPINVQYHADGSGATFGFSNHLATVCGTIEGTIFETSQYFTNVVANFLPALPTNWTGSYGDPAVAKAIASTANSVGNLEAADALETTPLLQFVDVDGLDPLTNFGSTLVIPEGGIVYNQLISGTNNPNGTPALQLAPNAPATQCIALIPPADYAVPSSAKGSFLPIGSYPIVAVSYLQGHTTGNGADLTNTQGLLSAPYTSEIIDAVTTIGPVSETTPEGTGFARVSPGRSNFTAAQVRACLVN
jgi:phosphate transport system substrate-binding protein